MEEERFSFPMKLKNLIRKLMLSDPTRLVSIPDTKEQARVKEWLLEEEE